MRINIVIGLAVLTIVAALGAVAMAATRYAAPQNVHEPCYSKQLWKGNDAYRPCWRVRIRRDGSGTVRANGEVYRIGLPESPPVSGCDAPSNPCDDYPEQG